MEERAMMNKLLAICIIAVTLCTFSCGQQTDDTVLLDSTPYMLTEAELADKRDTDMLNIEIIVGDKIFSAVLYDNEAAWELRSRLPLTLDMDELNGNEKYYYLSESLPTNASIPDGIREGDLMLYGNSCLVLFYESFSTSYSYTPLGRINDTDGLADSLGSGSIKVTLR